MLTLKLKYKCHDDGYYELLENTMKMYSSWIHYCFNRLQDSNGNISEKELRDLYNTSVNNIYLNSWIVQSGIKDAKAIYNSFTERLKEHEDNRTSNIEKLDEKLRRKKITPHAYRVKKEKALSNLTLVFGGKKNFTNLCSGKISKDEYRKKRLSPLYSIGECLYKGNRMFDFNHDCSITYKYNRKEHFRLLLSYGPNQRKTLEKIIALANDKKLSVSIKIDFDYVYISYDESMLTSISLSPVKNRVLGIDMNPNYIGISVVDWKSSSEYKVVENHVYDLKKFSDTYKDLNRFGNVSSDDARRVRLNNKRNYEVSKISHHIMSVFKHYRCEILAIENLKIKQKDKDKGKNYNALCNNHWLRETFVNGIRKLCNINHVRLVEVKPEFSSFIGNILFREEDAPDMVLASIEIGRRGYEFNEQYINKSKDIKKNIINPDKNDFMVQLEKSLEEFDLLDNGISLSDLYYSIKTEKDHPKLKGDPNKVMFRFDDVKHQISVMRFFSHRSMVSLLK